MWKRFLAFLLAAPLFIGFGYLFYLNPAVIELRVSATRSYSLPLPLLLLMAFLAGAAVIFALALLRETQWTLAEARRRRRDRRLQADRETLATGRRLQWEGRPEQALRVLRKPPGAAEPLDRLLLLGESALASQHPEEARAAAEEALARHGDQPEVHTLLSTAFHRLGEKTLSLAHLEKAATLDPESPRLLGALRDRYAGEGRWADALRVEEALLSRLRAADQVVAEQPLVQGLRFEAALSADGDSTVVERLRGVLAQHPDFLPAAVALGDRLRLVKRDDEAARVWERSATRRPLPILLSRLETLHRERRQTTRLISLYRRLLRRADQPSVRLALARVLAAEVKHDEAAEVLSSAGAHYERLPAFHEVWATVHRARGDVRAAFGSLERAFALSPPPTYACRRCGRTEPEWLSRCPGCGTWDSLDVVAPAP